MIVLMLSVAIKAKPPVALALKETVMPSAVSWMTILTLIGGTVAASSSSRKRTASSTRAFPTLKMPRKAPSTALR